MPDCPLSPGIVPVVQTPFLPTGELDLASLHRLVSATLDAGAAGFLVPAVASEVEALTPDERLTLLAETINAAEARVPVLAGCSSDDPAQALQLALAARRLGAAVYLVAVPQACYRHPETALPFFESIAREVDLPLVIQDLEWAGPGLPLATIAQLAAKLPTLCGIKIETVPAGPKYSAVRQALGPGFFISGGWAVPQMIEALDRGVDAMIPECSMVAVYARVFSLHRAGRRLDAIALFRQLLPILAFSNQDLRTSIAFFKRLLVRRGIFASDTLRGQPFPWDAYNTRTAAELIDAYLALDPRQAP